MFLWKKEVPFKNIHVDDKETKKIIKRLKLKMIESKFDINNTSNIENWRII